MQGVFTKFLQLWIPNKTDKGSVVTDVFEPNFTKLDQNAETTNQTLTNLNNNKLDKGTYTGKADDLKTDISRKLDKYQDVIATVNDYDDIVEDGFYIAGGLIQGAINAPSGNQTLVQVWSYYNNIYQNAVSYYDANQQFTRCFKKGIKNTKWESVDRIASTTQLGKIKVGTNLRIDASGFLHGNPDVDISGKLDKGTYSGNASNLKDEIDINLVKILGLEFGGELNNNNLKQAGKAYWDNANKSIYKCLVDNTTDYADTSKFEAISNDDLLLKLQNLHKYSYFLCDVDTIINKNEKVTTYKNITNNLNISYNNELFTFNQPGIYKVDITYSITGINSYRDLKLKIGTSDGKIQYAGIIVNAFNGAVAENVSGTVSTILNSKEASYFYITAFTNSPTETKIRFDKDQNFILITKLD